MSFAQSIAGPGAKPIVVSAKAIVLSGNDVLLLRQPDGTWDLPGGKVKPGESVKKGLKREVREETGLKVKPNALLKTTLSSHRKGHEKLVLSFLCPLDLSADTIRVSKEHIGFAKVSLARAIAFDMKPHHRSAVIAAAQRRISDNDQFIPCQSVLRALDHTSVALVS